jgi:ABC-type polysaccharide/polyol phosphate export permease
MIEASKKITPWHWAFFWTPERRHYLSIVSMLVRRELKVKYRGTMLGYLWSMLNPLLFMVIISVVFSHLVKGIENYSIYVLSGILFWTMVSM